jgi:hypothetical protein
VKGEREAATTAAVPIFRPAESLFLFGFTPCYFDVRIFGNRAVTEPHFLPRLFVAAFVAAWISFSGSY